MKRCFCRKIAFLLFQQQYKSWIQKRKKKEGNRVKWIKKYTRNMAQIRMQPIAERKTKKNWFEAETNCWCIQFNAQEKKREEDWIENGEFWNRNHQNRNNFNEERKSTSLKIHNNCICAIFEFGIHFFAFFVYSFHFIAGEAENDHKRGKRYTFTVWPLWKNDFHSQCASSFHLWNNSQHITQYCNIV